MSAVSIDERARAELEQRDGIGPQDYERAPIEAYEQERAAPVTSVDQSAWSADKATALRGEDFADMQPRLNLTATIKGLIAPQSLVGIIGPSGSGKTFFASDLGGSVAAGLPWRGRKVIKGLVIYGALEGAASARNRFSAWRMRRLGDRSSALPLRAMIDAINLRDPVDVLRLIEFIEAAEADYGEKVTLCFIDTLSRAMAGGNENAPDDMGALIRGADAIRLKTGATVVLIHHLGKDETRGARGHNSLFAALDTEITIRLNGDQRIATVTKQRDWPAGEEFAFRLEVVELGRDSDGDPVTSCVAVACDVPTPTRKQPSGKNQAALLAALQEWHRAHPDKEIVSSLELREIAASQDIGRKRLPEVISALEAIGWIQACVGGFKFIPESP